MEAASSGGMMAGREDSAADGGGADGSTRLAYVLGIPLAGDVAREWPQMGRSSEGEI